MDQVNWMSPLRLRQAVAVVFLAAACTVAYAGEAHVVYYEVSGHGAHQLRNELDKKGPLDQAGVRHDGYTTWQVSWKFRYAPDGSHCRIEDLSTSLEGTITLPHWQHGDNAPASLVNKWDGYLAALLVHEKGHYAHGMEAEKEIQTIGHSFQVAGDCKTIAVAFNEQANSILARYGAMEVTYDHDTDHGRTQGATFP